MNITSQSFPRAVACLLFVALGLTGSVLAFNGNGRVLPVAEANFRIGVDGDPQQEPQPNLLIATTQPVPVPAPGIDKPAGHPDLPMSVQLSETGKLVGRFSVIDPTSGERIRADAVRIFFIRGGETVLKVTPGVGGLFQVKIAPGSYSMVAAGSDGFSAFGIHVLPFQRENNGGLAGGSIVQIDASMIPPEDFSAVRPMIRKYSREISQLQDSVEPQNPKPAVKDAPNASAGGTPSYRRISVTLRADGTLVGQSNRFDRRQGKSVGVGNLVITLIQDGLILAQVPTDEQGVFRIKDLEPGVYSLVAAGPGGFAAFSIQVLARQANDTVSNNANADPFQTVSHVLLLQDGNGGGDFSANVSDPEDADALQQIADENLGSGSGGATPPATEAAGGGGDAGGEGGEGGGGGGGGGGLAGLLGGAALGAAIGGGGSGGGDDAQASPFR
jgi:hypothetical protein